MVEQLLARIKRALSLEAQAFEEIRDDAAFTPLAAAVGAVAIILGGLGAFLWASVNADTDVAPFAETVILGSIFTFLLWLAWVAVTYAVLSQFYHEQAAPDAVFRIFGLGVAPLALGVLVFIPGLGFGFGLLSITLTFFLTFFGMRSAFPAINPLRLLISLTAGAAVFMLVLPLLSSHDNAFASGVFIFEVAEDIVEEIADFDVADIDISDFLPQESGR